MSVAGDLKVLEEYCLGHGVFAMAAVQLGIPKRLVYIKNTDLDKIEDEEWNEATILINPVIKKCEGLTQYWEACASCLDNCGRVLRPYKIDLEYYDIEGNKKILYYYKKNEIFGEALFKVHMNKELFVLAKKKCKVLFYPYDTAETCTDSSCFFHLEILRNLPDLIVYNIAEQNFRMILLTYKGVRDKLLTYFNYLSMENAGSKTIELPFSLTDLADYLMIDRTAMMREIKRLKDENVIKKVKNKKRPFVSGRKDAVPPDFV